MDGRAPLRPVVRGHSRAFYGPLTGLRGGNANTKLFLCLQQSRKTVFDYGNISTLICWIMLKSLGVDRSRQVGPRNIFCSPGSGSPPRCRGSTPPPPTGPDFRARPATDQAGAARAREGGGRAPDALIGRGLGGGMAVSLQRQGLTGMPPPNYLGKDLFTYTLVLPGDTPNHENRVK
jgi:hypothetical protein